MSYDLAPSARLGSAFVTEPLLESRSRPRAAATVAPLALAGLAGLMFATAFPPLSWTIAAWVALAPFLVACAALSPLRAALAGMCVTITGAVGVASFLPAMLSRYFGLTVVPTWMAAVAIVAVLHGVFVGGYAAWVAWLVRRRAAYPILLAGGWVACEFARAHGALGSPWALTAYSQLRWTSLVQSADVAGPYGIGFLVAAVNACVAAWLVPALRGRRPLVAVATTAAALASALLYGQWRLGQTFGDGPPVAVAVVQGGAPPAEPSQRPARLARYVDLTRNGVAVGTTLIVWPEYAVEAYLEEASPTRDAVLHLADEARADLVLGGPHFESSASGTRYHNSAYLVRGGHLAARYDKQRLVPFAEDGRFARLFGGAPSGYAAGRGDRILPATALRIGAALCVESMSPELVRRSVRDGADLLVNLSNDAWFGGAAPARHQLDIATLRAVENRRYLVRAAATGFSAVIDPQGRTLALSELDAFQVLNATVRASHVVTPYQRFGDAFAWIVLAVVAGATLRPLLDRFRSFTTVRRSS
jgi:apolipoprotein N-acyltransferase